MPFRRLKPSSALELEVHDADSFLQSEKYAGASSIPLFLNTKAIVRARLKLPALTLSLMTTFPRIIHGYSLTHAAAVVVLMDQVSSARINGQEIRHSVLLLKGQFDCLVHEPEGRLVAIFYFRPPDEEPWRGLGDGYYFLNISFAALTSLRHSIMTALDTAANISGFPFDAAAQACMEQSLLTALKAVVHSREIVKPVDSAPAVAAYWRIVSDATKLIRSHPTTSLNSTELARRIGVSVRTLQKATQTVCSLTPLRYYQILRLWSARQQLRRGSAGLSVQACAAAHGFRHLGEFAATYKATFGELPSATLLGSMRKDSGS